MEAAEATYLTVDGFEMAQSLPILQYCGKLAGLYPSDPLKAFQVDEVINTVQEFSGRALEYKGDDIEKLKASRTKFVNETIPRQLGSLEKGEGPWAVGKSVSIADLSLYCLIAWFKSGSSELKYISPNALDGFTNIIAVYNAVGKLPAVVQWNKTHSW